MKPILNESEVTSKGEDFWTVIWISFETVTVTVTSTLNSDRSVSSLLGVTSILILIVIWNETENRLLLVCCPFALDLFRLCLNRHCLYRCCSVNVNETESVI